MTSVQARQASLVAFYGRKPGPLEAFLRSCQGGLAHATQQLGGAVRYHRASLPQMHATVIGLERRRNDGLENRNFHTLKACTKVMRLPGLFEFMLNCNYFPFNVQFGGFQDRDYPFQSRGARPYRRSFSIQGKIPVVIGWPVGVERCGGDQLSSGTASQAYLTNLEDLRRRAQKFNVLHRWHRRPTDVDNDLHIRLGIFEAEPSDSQREALEDEIRRRLSAWPPLVVKLAVSDLAVVSYPADDETLPEMRSEAIPLTDPRLQDENFVAGLYDRNHPV